MSAAYKLHIGDIYTCKVYIYKYIPWQYIHNIPHQHTFTQFPLSKSRGVPIAFFGGMVVWNLTRPAQDQWLIYQNKNSILSVWWQHYLMRYLKISWWTCHFWIGIVLNYISWFPYIQHAGYTHGSTVSAFFAHLALPYGICAQRSADRICLSWRLACMPMQARWTRVVQP